MQTKSCPQNAIKSKLKWFNGVNGLGKHEPLVLVFKKMYECFRSDLTILKSANFICKRNDNNGERNCSLSTSVVENVPLIALFWPAMLVKGPSVE